MVATESSTIASRLQKLWRSKVPKKSAETTKTIITLEACAADDLIKLGLDACSSSSSSIAMHAMILCTLGVGSFGHVFKVDLLLPNSSSTQKKNGADTGRLCVAAAAALKVFDYNEEMSSTSTSDMYTICMQEMAMAMALSNLATPMTPIVRALQVHTMKPSQKPDIGMLTIGGRPKPAQIFDGVEEEEEPVLYCMSMELCEGGELSDFLIDMKKGRGAGQLIMTEKAVASFFYPVAKAIEFCHWNRVLHLDVKPSNVLLRQKGRPETACLSDFSLATKIPPNKPSVAISSLSDMFRLKKAMGTDRYMAPEVGADQMYSPLADVFSLGCVLLNALTGAKFSWREFHDWRHLDAADMNKFLSEHFWQQSSITGDRRYGMMWDEALSPAAKSIITGMLCPDPLRRLNLNQVFFHPWLAEQHYSQQLKKKSSFKQALASGFRSIFR